MLYLVATPIGNLKEITYRAIEVLNSVDYIACEDTRTSKILLDNYNIHKPLISYHKFNETKACEGILKDLKAGKDIAIISDDTQMTLFTASGLLVGKVNKALICEDYVRYIYKSYLDWHYTQTFEGKRPNVSFLSGKKELFKISF